MVMELDKYSSQKTNYDFNCPICLEIFTNPVVVTCGHTFCNKCITSWLKESRDIVCPMCRTKILTVSRNIVVEK